MPNYFTSVEKTLTITRRLEFDAAHRVVGHETKCKNLHGHRYVVELEASPKAPGQLDLIGRVIDFSVLKGVVGKWIDEAWDHNILLNSEDPLLKVVDALDPDVFPKHPFVFYKQNPTAEVMAEFLLGKARDLLAQTDVLVTRVRIYETPNCFADYVERPTPVRPS